MQKLLSLLVLAGFFLTFGCSPQTTAGTDTMSDDGTDYAALAANYKRNPAALKAYVENCEANEAALVTARQDLNTIRNQSGAATQDLAALRTNLQNAQMENDRLRQQMVAMQNQTADRLDTDQQQVVPGVIFQVQLGAYAQNTVNPDLSTGNALELQDQGGVQKVVVSQFRTYANAAKLRDRLKQMGVNDAFVVAKNDGVRITVPEALRITGQN